MKLTISTAHEIISGLKETFRGNPLDHSGKETPLRATLFTAAQMEYYAKTLATTHRINDKSIPGHLIRRLGENERVLKAVRKLLVEAVKNRKSYNTGRGVAHR